MLSKSLIQFSAEGWDCVPSLLFDQRPNYGGGNEDNGDRLQKVPACTATFSALSPAASHHDPRLCWRLLDTPGQVWVSLLWVTAPFSWVLMCTSFCLCPQESISPILCTFWQLYGGPTGGLMPYPGLLHPESLLLQPSTADLYLHRRLSNTVLSQSLWGLWVLVCTRFV